MQASPKLEVTWIWGFISNNFVMKPEFLPAIVTVIEIAKAMVVVINNNSLSHSHSHSNLQVHA